MTLPQGAYTLDQIQNQNILQFIFEENLCENGVSKVQ